MWLDNNQAGYWLAVQIQNSQGSDAASQVSQRLFCHHDTLFISPLAFISDMVRESVFVTESSNGQEMGVFPFVMHPVLVMQETDSAQFSNLCVIWFHLAIYHEQMFQRREASVF